MKISKDDFPEETKPLIELLLGEEWPPATHEDLICSSEEDKEERAEGVAEWLQQWVPIDNKKVLDFGCGEGHLARYLKATGYDVTQSGSLEWDKEGDYFLTTDFSKLQGPYDVILLYDVLDHVENPTETLKSIKSLMDKDSKIVIRFHSWMSRHGAHLYYQLNKGWIQVVFTDEELKKMGITTSFQQKYDMPVNRQKKWINESGLKVNQEKVITSSVPVAFFKRPEFASRIPKVGGQFPSWQLSQDFNDYVVKL